MGKDKFNYRNFKEKKDRKRTDRNRTYSDAKRERMEQEYMTELKKLHGDFDKVFAEWEQENEKWMKEDTKESKVSLEKSKELSEKIMSILEKEQEAFKEYEREMQSLRNEEKALQSLEDERKKEEAEKIKQEYKEKTKKIRDDWKEVIKRECEKAENGKDYGEPEKLRKKLYEVEKESCKKLDEELQEYKIRIQKLMKSKGEKPKDSEAGTKKSGGTKTEPKKAEGTKTEPKKAGGTKTEPKKTEGAKTEPRKVDESKSDSKKVQTVDYIGIEDESIHSIQYQLDDWEINKFLSLKRDFAIATNSEKKSQIRREMANILGKDKKYTKPVEMKKEGTEKENKSGEQGKKQNPPERTMDDIRAEFEQIKEELRKGNQDPKLRERFFELKAEAKELKAREDATNGVVETGSNNSGKAGEKKEGRIKKFLNWLTEVFWDAETVEEKGEIKEQKHTKAKKAEEKAKRKAEKKAKRKKRLKILGFEDYDSYKVIEEGDKKKAVTEAKSEEELFGKLSEEERKQYEAELEQIRENMAKNVKTYVKEEKDEKMH